MGGAGGGGGRYELRWARRYRVLDGRWEWERVRGINRRCEVPVRRISERLSSGEPSVQVRLRSQAEAGLEQVLLGLCCGEREGVSIQRLFQGGGGWEEYFPFISREVTCVPANGERQVR